MADLNSAIAFTVAMIGLESSGKTTMMQNLSGGSKSVGEIFPTSGFEIHYVYITGYSINDPILVFDCSGEGRHHQNWKVFFEKVDGIGFVIDASDVDKFHFVKLVIDDLMKDDIVKERKIPIVFMLNQYDQSSAIDKDDITDQLGLNAIRKVTKNPTYIKDTQGYSGEGVAECFNFIKEHIPQKTD